MKKMNGSYDLGMVELPKDRIVPSTKPPELILTDSSTGQHTFLETILLDRGISWDSIEMVTFLLLTLPSCEPHSFL
jgi:hypothetical protein